MTLPYRLFHLNDPGLNISEPTGATKPHVLGICQSGTNYLPTRFTDPTTLLATHGYGPATELAAAMIELTGSCVVTKVASSSAGVLGAISQSGTGPVISNNASAPYDNYELKIKITLGGILGAGQFSYSLDDGHTYEGPIVIPGGGSYTVPNSGIALTMAAGTYVLNEVYTAACTAPIFTITEVALAYTAMRASIIDWDFICQAGACATDDAATALAAAWDVDMTGFETINHPAGCILDAGSTDTAPIAGYVQTSRRIMPAYGYADTTSLLPVAGKTYIKAPILNHLAMRAAVEMCSTDLGRVLTGPLWGIPAISTAFPTPVTHNEYLAANPVHDLGIATLRSWPGKLNEWYISGGRIKAPAGSDFTDWQYRRIFDIAQRIVFDEEAKFANRSFSTNDDGTIDEAEAKACEAIVLKALNNALVEPQNAEGTKGHVDGIRYRFDRAQDVAGTNQVVTIWGIKPRSYAHFIDSYGGFTTSV